jgi:hypothetical protein
VNKINIIFSRPRRAFFKVLEYVNCTRKCCVAMKKDPRKIKFRNFFENLIRLLFSTMVVRNRVPQKLEIIDGLFAEIKAFIAVCSFLRVQ